MDTVNLDAIRKEKKLKKKIKERLEEDKSKTSEYKYLHYLGTEPNFETAQKQNKTTVSRSKVEGDYEFFNTLYHKWNKLVSGGPFPIKASEGRLFAVHNMGPYKAIKLEAAQNCHGCGSGVEKGNMCFYHMRIGQQWKNKLYCLECVQYILYHLVALDIKPRNVHQKLLFSLPKVPLQVKGLTGYKF
jgi:hypothetical protein